MRRERHSSEFCGVLNALMARRMGRVESEEKPGSVEKRALRVGSHFKEKENRVRTQLCPRHGQDMEECGFQCKFSQFEVSDPLRSRPNRATSLQKARV